jgi:hypothetical protein
MVYDFWLFVNGSSYGRIDKPLKVCYDLHIEYEHTATRSNLMITTVSSLLTANDVPHALAEHTLAIFIHGGAIVVRETEFGNVTVAYPSGQYTAFSAADVVNHVLWLLSDEFEAVNEAGDAIPLPEARRTYAPFLTMLIIAGWLLVLVAAMGL